MFKGVHYKHILEGCSEIENLHKGYWVYVEDKIKDDSHKNITSSADYEYS